MLETPLWKKISLWVLTLGLAVAALPSLLGPFMASTEPEAGDDQAESVATAQREDNEGP